MAFPYSMNEAFAGNLGSSDTYVRYVDRFVFILCYYCYAGRFRMPKVSLRLYVIKVNLYVYFIFLLLLTLHMLDSSKDNIRLEILRDS
jgi:hypothetical protein